MTPYLDPAGARHEAECLTRELSPRIRFGDSWFPAVFETERVNIARKKMFRVAALLWHASLHVQRDRVVRICQPVTALGLEGEALLAENYQVERTSRRSPILHDSIGGQWIPLFPVPAKEEE